MGEAVFPKPSVFWVVLAATLMHAFWGVASLVWSETLLVTPVYPVLAVLGDVRLVTLAYLLAASLASLSLSARLHGTPAGYMLLLPQQAVMVVSLVGAMATILAGQYPDGYRPAGNATVFIASDQVGYLVLAFAHTLAILDAYLVLAGVRLWMRR